MSIFLIVGVSVLALLLGGPVAVFRPVIELMFVVFAAALVLHWSAIRFDLRSWRPPQ